MKLSPPCRFRDRSYVVDVGDNDQPSQTMLMTATPAVQAMNLTAIVQAADGARFVTSAHCPSALMEQVVGYILERCDYVLWPSVTSEVRALIDDDRPYAAIATYFAHVGERWDEERLELGGLHLGPPDREG